VRKFLSLLLLPISAGPVSAATSPISSAQYLVQSVIVPRFETVASAAIEQQAAWTSFCENRTRGGAENLRAEFNKVGDAWANIEFVRIGPPAAELRAERFNFWLDRRDMAGKALDAMLASTDAKSLDPATIADGSVAGQGMPVLERLLYDDSALAKLLAKDGEADRRCAVGMAIAHNLSSIADAIATDWTKPDGAAAAIAANRSWGYHFADANQAASVMVTDLITGLEMLKDFNLPMTYHYLADKASPRLAEGARSARSLRDVELKFAGIRSMLDTFMAAAPSAQKAKLDMAFADADAKLVAVAAAAKSDDTAKELARLTTAIASFSALKQTAMNVIPEATGISLGFNNLDGD